MLVKLKGSLINMYFSFAVIALCILLYSCSGNESGSKINEATQTTDTKTTSTTPSDVCKLITVEEAKAVIGGDVKKGGEGEGMCQYLEAGDKLSQSGFVTVLLAPGSASGYDNYILNAEKGFVAKAKPVAGVGEKAVFIAGQLIVLSGQHYLTVWIGKDISEEQIIALEKTVALKAIERL